MKTPAPIQTRREFVNQTALGLGLLILPSGILRGQASPNSKLNIALIGAGGRATAHFGSVSGENVVALCDVDDRVLAAAGKQFPKAKHYKDWRKCLDHPGLDAIVCSTTDHTHAAISIWAMMRGLHVYCEKPLANSVEEARMVRATYLERRGKVATQVGTQLHALNHFAEVRKLVREGSIGELKRVDAWGNRQIPRPGHPKGLGEVPAHLDFDLWLGPAPVHPYHPDYFSATVPGSNCLNWNMFWDFGSGQVGDMGSHTMDLVWNAIDADSPLSAWAEGDPFHPEVSPVKLHTRFRLPANDWRPPIEVHWHQGGAMPEGPTDTALRGIAHGAMFTGTKGTLVSDFGSLCVIPTDVPRDARHSRTGTKGGYDHAAEWIAACKGGLETACNFDYAGRMIEMMLLGHVAYRIGEEIIYDASRAKVTSHESANVHLAKKYREGWSLVG